MLEFRVSSFYCKVSSSLITPTCKETPISCAGSSRKSLGCGKGRAHYGCREALAHVGRVRDQGQGHREWDIPLAMASLPCHCLIR